MYCSLKGCKYGMGVIKPIRGSAIIPTQGFRLSHFPHKVQMIDVKALLSTIYKATAV